MQALADQPDLHGPVASTAILWRVLEGIDADVLGRLRTARALARFPRIMVTAVHELVPRSGLP